MENRNDLATALLPSGAAVSGWIIRDIEGNPVWFQEQGIHGLKMPYQQLKIKDEGNGSRKRQS